MRMARGSPFSCGCEHVAARRPALPLPLPRRLSSPQTIAAALSYKTPFAAPLERQDEMEAAKRALAAPPPPGGAGKGGVKGGGRATAGGRGGRGGGGGSGAAAAEEGGVAGGSFAAGQQSDHFVLVEAFQLWRRARAKGPGEAAKVRVWTQEVQRMVGRPPQYPNDALGAQAPLSLHRHRCRACPGVCE
jgi:hypothetical protein